MPPNLFTLTASQPEKKLMPCGKRTGQIPTLGHKFSKRADVYTQDPRPSFINEGLQKKGGVNPTPTNQRPPPPPPQPPGPKSMTNILTLKVAIIIFLTTNVYPLKPSEGFPEREFLTNIVQTTSYHFTASNQPVQFTFIRTNSSIVGVYLPNVKTNFVLKGSYQSTAWQLGQPSDIHFEWHPEPTNANSADLPH